MKCRNPFCQEKSVQKIVTKTGYCVRCNQIVRRNGATSDGIPVRPRPVKEPTQVLGVLVECILNGIVPESMENNRWYSRWCWENNLDPQTTADVAKKYRIDLTRSLFPTEEGRDVILWQKRALN